MKKLILMFFLTLSLFADDTYKWKKGFGPSVVLGLGKNNGNISMKIDLRAQVLSYRKTIGMLTEQGFSLGLGSAYFTNNGFGTYIDLGYGNYGFSQFNGRIRSGITGDGDFFSGISLTKSFAIFIADTSFDYIYKDKENEKVLTFGLGFGF